MSKRGANVQIWVTFTPESAFVRSGTIVEIQAIEKAVYRYAKVHWETEFDQKTPLVNFELKIIFSKIDIARDFMGAFLP